MPAADRFETIDKGTAVVVALLLLLGESATRCIVGFFRVKYEANYEAIFPNAVELVSSMAT